MPGVTLHSSNRLEVLIDRLAGLIAVPLADPFAAETILVQSRGMERWVSMELANRHGVCANCRFPFPNSYIGEIFGMLLPPALKDSPFAPERLGWKIMDTLPGFLDQPSFAGIKKYLEDGPGAFKLYQLSRRIAAVFDQYLLFRPEMIMEWEKEGRGRDGGWQAELWRCLSRELQARHRAALLTRFLEETGKGNLREQPAGLPERVSVFGISALPPFHLRTLAAFSRFTDVHLFVMNSCREYWGDIMSGRDINRLARRSKSAASAGDLLLEKGNSLLASMGMLGRDFFDMLISFNCSEDFEFIETGRDTLLHSIQSDVLELLDGPPEKKCAFDGSIEVHSCHSPLREIEVLQDNLLALFEARPDIRPRDVLVMAPDIEAYAPFIDAVFSLPEADPKSIPFSIADKGMKVESPVVSAFLNLLRIPRSRLGAARIMEVLESESIREKFALTEPDAATVRQWVREARIRWGLDVEYREKLGIPGFAQNTWRAGLDRMLLGYALPEKDGELFAGALPFEGIEGGASDILGRFLAFTEKLFTAAEAMQIERTLQDWADFLTAMAGDFFPGQGDISADLEFLRRAFSELRGFGEILNGKVGPDIIIDHLERRLDQEGFGGRFLSGGITFCAMLPMRSIPFKVICLVGMDDGAYPRDSVSPGFDIIAKEPRPGDRSRRFDDRYLFLETLLSARDKIYLSYVGQDIRDNSPRPPSVLVSELLDYLANGYGIEDITVKHALQAFSPRYFGAGDLFSYSRENEAAARGLMGGQMRELMDGATGSRSAPAFFTTGLSEPDAGFRDVSIEDLCRFFANPARFLLARRLGLFLDDRAYVLDEKEPFSVEGLDRHELESSLLEKVLEGRNIRAELQRVRAGGSIPPGAPGDCWFEDTCAAIEALAGRVTALRAGAAREPVTVDLALSGFRITGRITGLYPGGMIRHQLRDRERDRLTFWITHLVLDCVGEAPPSPAVSTLCTEKLNCRYKCPPDSRAVLGELLNVYWQGLKRPLPFFPRSSWAYLEALLKSNSDPVEQARRKWEKGDYYADLDDPYIYRCFANSDPLESAEFDELARTVLGPALEHGEFKPPK